MVLQGRQESPAALDGYQGENLKLHAQWIGLRAEQGRVLLAHHTDRYTNGQCWTVIYFYANLTSGLVGQQEFV